MKKASAQKRKKWKEKFVAERKTIQKLQKEKQNHLNQIFIFWHIGSRRVSGITVQLFFDQNCLCHLLLEYIYIF